MHQSFVTMAPTPWEYADFVFSSSKFLHMPHSAGTAIWLCFSLQLHLSRIMRKPAFCICENKDADQLRGKLEADQRLCFRYIESLYFLNLKPSSVASQPGLCLTWSETPKTGFLTSRLILANTQVLGVCPALRGQCKSKWATSWENQRSGFRPGPTQTRLFSYWIWLEAWKFGFRK